MSVAEKVLLWVLLAAAIALCTPLLSWWGVQQAIWLGLPAAMVWSLLWLTVVFGALLAAHFTDHSVDHSAPGSGQATGPRAPERVGGTGTTP